ncbi:hypothetical protein BV20DRAFT_1051950 [Pilatotrama ljubarskyi]|nr:hypothetical protein BV20DRAFT_1051950 [Pilatotrama ljubarskyi]
MILATSIFAPLKVLFSSTRFKSSERRSLRSSSPKPTTRSISPTVVPMERKLRVDDVHREQIDWAPRLGFQLECKLLPLEKAQTRQEIDWAPHLGFQALGCKLLSIEDAQRRMLHCRV